MAEWEKQVAAVNLLVSDLERSKTFYREVFGLVPKFEDADGAVFHLTNVFLMLHRDPAREAPADGVLRLAREGAGQLAIIVGDVDAVRAELDEHGVTPISGPTDRHWGMRTMTFADPDGNTWEIAQDLD